MWDFPKWILSQMSTSNISSCSTKKEVIPNFYSIYFLWFVHLTPMPRILQEMTLGKSLSNIDIHLDCSNSSLKSMLLSPGNDGISGLNLCLCTQLLLSCHFSTHTRALHPCKMTGKCLDFLGCRNSQVFSYQKEKSEGL